LKLGMVSSITKGQNIRVSDDNSSITKGISFVDM
jgi:hypothetical protein